MFEEEFIVFKTVAETNNITLAAKRLHISQPAISLQIQNIENFYGAKFFVRSNKGVTLTAVGKVFYEFICNMLEMLENVQKEIVILSGKNRSEFRFGATLTIGDYIVPDLLVHMARWHPQIDLSVRIANTGTIVQEVLERKFRIGLAEGPITPSRELIVESFWQDELVVVVSRDHPWGKRDTISLSELADAKLILREEGSGTRKVFEQSIKKQGKTWTDFRIAMELGSLQSIKKAVAAGLGITVISELAILQDPDLHSIRVEEMAMKRELSLVTNSNNGPLTVEELFFIDLLRNRLLLTKVLGTSLKDSTI